MLSKGASWSRITPQFKAEADKVKRGKWVKRAYKLIFSATLGKLQQMLGYTTAAVIRKECYCFVMIFIVLHMGVPLFHSHAKPLAMLVLL